MNVSTPHEAVTAYLPELQQVAVAMHRRVARKVDADDLLSAAVARLLPEMHNWRPEAGQTQRTFLLERAKKRMLDYCRELDPMPKLARIHLKQIRACQERCEGAGGKPDAAALAELTGLTSRQVDETLRMARAVDFIPLEAPARPGGDGDADAPAPTDLPEREDRSDRPEPDFWPSMLAGLTDLQARILELFYQQGMTTREIAKEIGRSQPRVSQLMSAALEQLRKRFAVTVAAA